MLWATIDTRADTRFVGKRNIASNDRCEPREATRNTDRLDVRTVGQFSGFERKHLCDPDGDTAADRRIICPGKPTTYVNKPLALFEKLAETDDFSCAASSVR